MCTDSRKSLHIGFNIIKFLLHKMYLKWSIKLFSKVAEVCSNTYTTTSWGFVMWINFDTLMIISDTLLRY